jgi:hypothetical protein
LSLLTHCLRIPRLRRSIAEYALYLFGISLVQSGEKSGNSG